MTRHDDPTALRKELEAIPKEERLEYLATLPHDRLAAFRRLLSPEDRRKLNAHVDRRLKRQATPTYESWLADALDGRATTPDAMIEALREVMQRLRPQDAEWIRRIDETASAGSFSKRQAAVIEGIYARYFQTPR